MGKPLSHEPSLNPPDEPSETCQECGKELEDEAYEVEMPGRFHDVWVCSSECASEYVTSWAEAMAEANDPEVHGYDIN